MQKLLLISVVICTLAMPAYFENSAPHGVQLRKVLRSFAAFTAFYVFSLLVIYPRLF